MDVTHSQCAFHMISESIRHLGHLLVNIITTQDDIEVVDVS